MKFNIKHNKNGEFSFHHPVPLLHPTIGQFVRFNDDVLHGFLKAGEIEVLKSSVWQVVSIETDISQRKAMTTITLEWYRDKEPIYENTIVSFQKEIEAWR